MTHYGRLPAENIPDDLLLAMAEPGEAVGDILGIGKAISSAGRWTGTAFGDAYSAARKGVSAIRGLADNPWIKYGAIGAAYIIPGGAVVMTAVVAANEIVKAVEAGGKAGTEARKIISNTYKILRDPKSSAADRAGARRGLAQIAKAKRIPWAKQTPAQRKVTRARMLKAIRATALRHRLARMTPAQRRAWILAGIKRARGAGRRVKKAGTPPRLGRGGARAQRAATRRKALARRKVVAARALAARRKLRAGRSRATVNAAKAAAAKLRRTGAIARRAKDRAARAARASAIRRAEAKSKRPKKKPLPAGSLARATPGYFVTAGGKVDPGRFLKV